MVDRRCPLGDKTIELPQMMDSTCTLQSKPQSSTARLSLWFWTEKARTLRYLGKCWGALWFWPEKARSVCHLGTCWGALWFWPKRARPFHHLERRAGELCGFPRWWTVRAFSGQNRRAPQMMDSAGRLRSKSYSSPDDGQYVPSLCQNHRAPQMMDSTCLLRSKS
jgi:hypothetical protein